MMKNLLTVLAAICLISCKPSSVEPGVALNLAEERAASLGNVRYNLNFDLTAEAGDVAGIQEVYFIADKKAPVVLDFKAATEAVKTVAVNGKELAATHVVNEHIVIPAKHIKRGENSVKIEFVAPETSLNRRDEFVYTLLVPDRARTLFPCFDQPDIKAEFNLSLSIPNDWVAISNTDTIEESTEILLSGDDPKAVKKMLRFAPTEPLSTYLFSFVAGKFTRVKDGNISMYHRETDPAKVAQCTEVLRQVNAALAWMEEYTGIPYPFAKYDFVVLPDFQYGGMEHTGATLYNDSRIFLGPNPTVQEELNRANLIAHETAHMWFGDYVTMKWFNDVWTKEVFANFFAARMVRPLFPEVNHTLNDLATLYASAYSEDRTPGSNAIQRPLDNLQDAGLIYCNIIYDKAPVVMDKLEALIGQEQFREGIHEYLQKYGYGNATWDDLIAILDSRTDADLVEWSRVWIKEKGMPIYTATGQRDPFGAGNVWQQDFESRMTSGGCWIPNIDGRGYGCFELDPASAAFIMTNWRRYDAVPRMSLLMTLYENSYRGYVPRDHFVRWCAKEMVGESEPLIFGQMLKYGAAEAEKMKFTPRSAAWAFEMALVDVASDRNQTHQKRLLAFRRLYATASDTANLQMLYEMWRQQTSYKGLNLSEYDYTQMAYQLMVHFPDRAAEIAQVQGGRITNPDRLETFRFVCTAASPDPTERAALFASLLASPEARRPESRVLSALALLCHRCRTSESMFYIVPTLENLEAIQRSGDIFFPSSWCSILMAHQHSEEAANLVYDWLTAHPDFNPLLATKVLQSL